MLLSKIMSSAICTYIYVILITGVAIWQLLLEVAALKGSTFSRKAVGRDSL